MENWIRDIVDNMPSDEDIPNPSEHRNMLYSLFEQLMAHGRSEGFDEPEAMAMLEGVLGLKPETMIYIPLMRLWYLERQKKGV